jgi:hypothetical protein
MNSWKLNSSIGYLFRNSVAQFFHIRYVDIYKFIKNISPKGVISTPFGEYVLTFQKVNDFSKHLKSKEVVINSQKFEVYYEYYPGDAGNWDNPPTPEEYLIKRVFWRNLDVTDLIDDTSLLEEIENKLYNL